MQGQKIKDEFRGPMGPQIIIANWIIGHLHQSNTSFASDLFTDTKNGIISWEDSDEDTINSLILKEVDISKLLSSFPDKVFNQKSANFFLALNEKWVNQTGITAQKKTERLIALTNAYKSGKSELDPSTLSQEMDISIQDALLSIPTSMNIDSYAKFLGEIAIEGIFEDAKIIALKNCLELENHLNSKLERLDVKGHREIKVTKHHLKSIQRAAANLRKSLLGITDKESLPAQLQLDVLKKVATNSRLRRAFTRDITQQILAEENKLDAISAVEGSEVKDTMIKMMCVLDSKDMGHFKELMSDVMKELQSQHNLSPHWTAGVSRNYNYVMSYPVGLFFYVLDCLSAAAEFLWVYAQKAGYGVYDYLAGNTAPRDIKFETYSSLKEEAAGEMEAIVKAVHAVEIPPAIFSPKIQLRDKILDALKAYRKDHTISLDALKRDLQILDCENIELSTKFEALKALEDPKKFVRAAYDLLKDPLMNQGIDTALDSWANAAKGLNSVKKGLGL